MMFSNKITNLKKLGEVPDRFLSLMQNCYDNYREVVYQDEEKWKRFETLFCHYLDFMHRQFINPFEFEPYHKKIKEPFDYEEFSLAFIRPLIIFEESELIGTENIYQVEALLERHENVILLANHQTEPDPQILNLILEKDHPRLAKEMIFIAGDRVVTDPMAVPSSMGTHLICIYSKKHVENPPELKEEKLKHNQRTMKILSQLLSEGGKCIYVAPSGGRDRPGPNGNVEVAKFNPQSIEMLRLMAEHADRPTHFFPLALKTYDILPPPDDVNTELGEERCSKRSAVGIAFGQQIDMDSFPGSECQDRKEKRQKRADYIWDLVNQQYYGFTSGKRF